MQKLDAVVIGSGPNGLAAAVCLAQAGLAVRVVEAHAEIGGGTRTAELTGPGYLHDVCSAIHPTALISPFFKSLALEAHGVSWIKPEVAAAHPLPDGSAALLYEDFARMRESLGDADAETWQRFFGAFHEHRDELFAELLGPLPIPPKSPLLFARFGLSALRSASGFSRSKFRGAAAQALFAGCAAHSIVPLEEAFTASFGMVLALSAHAVGWPLPRGGSRAISDALAAIFRGYGGEIETGHAVTSLDELPESRVVLFDTSPSAMARIAGHQLPAEYRDQLHAFRQGPGIFKLDYALSGPIPWTAKACGQAATVHLGGTLEELETSERTLSGRDPAEAPFCLLSQQSVFDPTRAPPGKHTAWIYCHVPSDCRVDMTARIEAQLERFAPGFRDLVIARAVHTPQDFAAYNPNYIGGDILGGANDWFQLLARPMLRLDPYSTPNPKLYLCSASTPPGGGVHGMCGYHAAQSALGRVFARG